MTRTCVWNIIHSGLAYIKKTRIVRWFSSTNDYICGGMRKLTSKRFWICPRAPRRPFFARCSRSRLHTTQTSRIFPSEVFPRHLSVWSGPVYSSPLRARLRRSVDIMIYYVIMSYIPYLRIKSTPTAMNTTPVWGITHRPQPPRREDSSVYRVRLAYNTSMVSAV